MNDETMVLADELAGLKARAEKLEADHNVTWLYNSGGTRTYAEL
jgi:hypothetical protein